MSRRYRLAMLAYPRAFRGRYGPEMLATLTDGDGVRGGPSNREACALVVHGVSQRLAPAHARGLLGLLGAMALLVALVPDSWWAHSSLDPGLSPYVGVVGPPDEVRTPLGLIGLIAMAAGASRFAVAAAAFVPYAALVSADIGMGYGRASLRVDAVDALPLALISAAFAVGTWFAARAMRSTASGSRGVLVVAFPLGAAAFAAIGSTVTAIGTQYGSGGPTVPVGPAPFANAGLALLLCVVIAGSATGIAALSMRAARGDGDEVVAR